MFMKNYIGFKILIFFDVRWRIPTSRIVQNYEELPTYAIIKQTTLF